MQGRLLVAAVALALALQSPGAAGSRPAADAAELLSRARVPGLSLAVIEGGRVTRVASLGLADAGSATPVDRDTLFEAASLSKPVFATIVLRWAQRGDLDLDQPLFDLLPYDRLAHDPRARELTARLVLSHQTGLPNWGDERLDLLFEPGAGFNYSGEGYVYLQRVLEALSGESLDSLARREIFEPLGMARSRFDWPAEEASRRVAKRHDDVGRPAPPPRETHQNAAASLLTTAEEYAQFVVAWMGGALLSSQTVEAALRPAVRMDGSETRTPKPPEVYQRIAWGLGWGLIEPDGIAWHWGDNGPAKAFVAFDRERRSGVVYFANGENGLAFARQLVAPVVGDVGPALAWNGYDTLDHPGFEEQLAGIAAEKEHRFGDAITAFERAVALAPDRNETARRAEWLADLQAVRENPVELPATLMQRYAGTYGDRHLGVEAGRLVYQRGDARAYRLIPLSETLFALEGAATFRLEVVTDESGEPIKLIGHYLGHDDESPREAPSD